MNCCPFLGCNARQNCTGSHSAVALSYNSMSRHMFAGTTAASGMYP
eukprot:IDg12308t1